MSGRDAARGFEYQFLCTLEHALAGLLASDGAFTAVDVDAGGVDDDSGVDSEIVDFALMEDDRRALAAQVKSGVPGSRIGASDVVRVFLRLLTNDADRYLLITNRRPGPGAEALLQMLQRYRDGSQSLQRTREALLGLIEGSARLHAVASAASDQWWHRLRRAEVVVDTRTTEETYEQVREKVRAARHLLDPENIGWDAAGLLAKYLVTVVLGAAAGSRQTLPRTDIEAHLRIDSAIARSVLQQRDWAVHVTPAPRGTDISRYSILTKIAAVLPTPVRHQSVPICVLTGLSGMGKTSIAAAWSDDRADAYAAVFWVDASTVAQVQTSFLSIDRWLNRRDAPADHRDVKAAVFAALGRTARPWLMVFDNATEPHSIHEWLPPRGLGHVIVTTVRQGGFTGPGTATIEIPPMTVEESTRLLSRRLLNTDELPELQHERIRYLSTKLLHWPLALELAAAYLSNCLGGIAGIDEYERLMMRSLDDQDSKPVDYPTTLISAITLSWRGLADSADMRHRTAAGILRCAAFTAARRIPLHLLVPPAELDFASPDMGTTISVYNELFGVPIGEVARAMRSHSLVAVDIPLPLSIESIESPRPSTSGYSVQMNEIVQEIIRQSVTAEDLTEHVLEVLAFNAQRWLRVININERFDLYNPVLNHSLEICEHAIEHGVRSPFIALMWGNTASSLQIADHPALAVRYFRVELDYLKDAEHVPVLLLQTAACLANALIDAADDPSAVADEALHLLEFCIPRIGEAMEKDDVETAKAVYLALTAARALAGRGIESVKLGNLISALSDYAKIMRPDEESTRMEEMSRLGELIRAREFRVADDLIVKLLAQVGPYSIYKWQLLGSQAECHARLQDWAHAEDIATIFLEAARENSLRASDTGFFCRNLGLACLTGLMHGDRLAVPVFENMMRVADEFERHGNVMRSIEHTLVSLFRGIRSGLQLDPESAAQAISTLNLANLPATGQFYLAQLAGRVLRRWIDMTRSEGLCPEPALLDFGHSHEPGIRIVPRTAGVNNGALSQVDPSAMPAVCFGLAQLGRSQGSARRETSDLAYELHLALKLIGIQSKIIEVKLDILLDNAGVDTSEMTHSAPARTCGCRHHYALWVDTLGLFVDTAISHHEFVSEIRDPNPMNLGAVFLNLDLTNLPNFVFSIRRPNMIISYQDARIVNISDVLATVPKEGQATSVANMCLLAIYGLLTLVEWKRGSLDAILSTNPDLEKIMGGLALPGS